MTNSLNENQHFICSKCRGLFEAQIWRIIDEDDYPQLLEQIKKENLFSVYCPHCHHEYMLNEPFLIVQRNRRLRLIYVVAEGTSLKAERDHLRRLVNILMKNQNNNWLMEWENHVRVIPQELLSVALTEQ